MTPPCQCCGLVRLHGLEDRCLPSGAGPGVAVVSYLSDPEVIDASGAPIQPAHIDWGDGSSSAVAVGPAGPGQVFVQALRFFDGPREFQVTITLPADDAGAAPRVIRLRVLILPPSHDPPTVLAPGGVDHGLSGQVEPSGPSGNPGLGTGDVVTIIIQVPPPTTPPTEQSPHIAQRDFGTVRPAPVPSVLAAPVQPTASPSPSSSAARPASAPGSFAPVVPFVSIPLPSFGSLVVPASADRASRPGDWPGQPWESNAPAVLTTLEGDQAARFLLGLAEDPEVSPAGDRVSAAVPHGVSLTPETRDLGAAAADCERLIGQLAGEPLPEEGAPAGAAPERAAGRRWAIWLAPLGLAGSAGLFWRRRRSGAW